jgi:hypothetical protein
MVIARAWTKILTIVSEADNDATAPARIGSSSVSMTDSLGLPLQPNFERQISSAQSFDVRGIYVAGKTGDVFNFAWDGGAW